MVLVKSIGYGSIELLGYRRKVLDFQEKLKSCNRPGGLTEFDISGSMRKPPSCEPLKVYKRKGFRNGRTSKFKPHRMGVQVPRSVDSEVPSKESLRVIRIMSTRIAKKKWTWQNSWWFDANRTTREVFRSCPRPYFIMLSA